VWETVTEIHASSEIRTHDLSNQSAKTYASDRSVAFLIEYSKGSLKSNDDKTSLCKVVTQKDRDQYQAILTINVRVSRCMLSIH